MDDIRTKKVESLNMCDICGTYSDETFYCVECSQPLCKNCVPLHNNFRLLKGHNINIQAVRCEDTVKHDYVNILASNNHKTSDNSTPVVVHTDKEASIYTGYDDVANRSEKTVVKCVDVTANIVLKSTERAAPDNFNQADWTDGCWKPLFVDTHHSVLDYNDVKKSPSLSFMPKNLDALKRPFFSSAPDISACGRTDMPPPKVCRDSYEDTSDVVYIYSSFNEVSDLAKEEQMKSLNVNGTVSACADVRGDLLDLSRKHGSCGDVNVTNFHTYVNDPNHPICRLIRKLPELPNTGSSKLSNIYDYVDKPSTSLSKSDAGINRRRQLSEPLLNETTHFNHANGHVNVTNGAKTESVTTKSTLGIRPPDLTDIGISPRRMHQNKRGEARTPEEPRKLQTVSGDHFHVQIENTPLASKSKIVGERMLVLEEGQIRILDKDTKLCIATFLLPWIRKVSCHGDNLSVKLGKKSAFGKGIIRIRNHPYVIEEILGLVRGYCKHKCSFS
ncbi:uncharacterized protein LOC127874924 [Dreissena polymorpha]|uniref:B box-type domain-containing protein n=1 Tax=Dreissena polymorpha TaxID=45954 RepID=A0A9D4R2Y3_DREPO|nr:uncharacterized protein LOC127874924 [Dreissena polymorpha]KAH3852253.1 hypothetical protein DPMN_094755 [Dreissena polymorpha]